MAVLEDIANRLTPDEVKLYEQSQGKAANPLSPLAFLAELRGTEPKKEVGLLSSSGGESTLADLQRKQQSMQPIPQHAQQAQQTNQTQTQPQPQPQQPQPTPLTLMGPDGQEVTFKDPDINRQNIQNFIDKGFDVTDGSLPSGLRMSDTQVTDQGDFRLQQAQQDLAQAQEQLKNLDVSNNPQLQQILSGITSKYDQRIREMQDANRSRQAQLGQIGVRTGAGRYTASFGGVLAEEERQGIQRVSELEAAKQSALLQAQLAFEDREYTRYSDAVNRAETAYQNQIENLDRLNKLAIEQQKLLLEEREDFRLEQEFMAEQQQSRLDNISFGLINMLTGDDKQDAGLFEEASRLYGLDPVQVRSAVLEKKAEQDQKQFGLLQGVAREYASAQQLFPGITMEQFQVLKDPLSPLTEQKLISEINRIELDNSLAPLRKEQLIADIENTYSAIQERNRKIQELDKASSPEAKLEAVAPALNLTNQLLNSPHLSKISGAKGIGAIGIPFSDKTIGSLYGSAEQETLNQYNQLISILSLQNRQQLRGSGTISDFEARTLEKAASSLSRGLNDQAFKRQLRQVRGAMATAAGGSAAVKITDSQGNEQYIQADREGISQAIADGLSVEYQ